MSDPKTHRMIQTRDGVAEVPRTQEGVPLKEYFQNTELPADLERAVVYVTPKGPALAKPDPVPWTEAHDRTAEGLCRQAEGADRRARLLFPRPSVPMPGVSPMRRAMPETR